MLLTTIRPDTSEAGLITLGNRHMVYDSRRIEASVEDISPMTDALLQGVWGKQMFRIILTARQKTTVDRLTYSFR